MLRHPPTTKVETRLLATSSANHKFRIAATCKAHREKQQNKCKQIKVPQQGSNLGLEARKLECCQLSHAGQDDDVCFNICRCGGEKEKGGGRLGERRKKVKENIFSPITHHSQVSQPHLALRHPPSTKLGEAKPARTPVCASGYIIMTPSPWVVPGNLRR